MAVSYALDGSPRSRPSRGGVMITSWITRPSRTQPKCHSPLASLMTLPSPSRNRPSMSQLPTSRPNSISLAAGSGLGPSARNTSTIAESARGLAVVLTGQRYRRHGVADSHDRAPISENGAHDRATVDGAAGQDSGRSRV